MTSALVEELLSRNSKVHQGLPPLIPMIEAARQAGLETAIILSCSDPRLNPYAIFGIDPSVRGISMVRNAGGRAMDAIRSISVLQTIASAKTLVVLHHTDCGMTHFHDARVREALIKFAPQEKETINATKYGEITGSIEDSVKEDVEHLRSSPFILPGTLIVGLKMDTFTGVVTKVTEAKIEEH
ncbi:carbonic anhydrase [Trichoderma citrinoviride]|uniref:Carbonic anhydrase n=1 Tax=Trichoderma citrinoviride TaxID=58853 RepID=A0A2T4BC58_9HYPO|nr:carbonic anhydrase [Trichoderma citrinoviride]PTB66914.1 carbonic anhydrase [Trichoderma citrinoviride]